MNVTKKTLLIVIGGSKMRSIYMRYKYEIKMKLQARQVKPYVLEFPKELNEEEINFINKILKSGVKYEIFTNCQLVKQKLEE